MSIQVCCVKVRAVIVVLMSQELRPREGSESKERRKQNNRQPPHRKRLHGKRDEGRPAVGTCGDHEKQTLCVKNRSVYVLQSLVSNTSMESFSPVTDGRFADTFTWRPHFAARNPGRRFRCAEFFGVRRSSEQACWRAWRRCTLRPSLTGRDSRLPRACTAFWTCTDRIKLHVTWLLRYTPT